MKTNVITKTFAIAINVKEFAKLLHSVDFSSPRIFDRTTKFRARTMRLLSESTIYKVPDESNVSPLGVLNWPTALPDRVFEFGNQHGVAAVVITQAQWPAAQMDAIRGHQFNDSLINVPGK